MISSELNHILEACWPFFVSFVKCSLPPCLPFPHPGVRFSLFALSEFFTIHFSSFAWGSVQFRLSSFHCLPDCESTFSIGLSVAAKEAASLFLLPASSLPPRLASVPRLSLPASFLFLLFPLSLFISLSLSSPPPTPPPSAGQEFCARRATVAGLAPRQQGAGPAGGGAGRERGHRSCRSCWESARADHKAAAEKACRPARSALGLGLRQTLCASDDREPQPPFISEVLCSALLAGPPSPLLRRLLPSSFPRALSLASAFPASLRHRGRHG